MLLTNASDAPVQATVAYDQAELNIQGLSESRAYGEACCRVAQAGSLRVTLGPRSALAMRWEEEK